MISVNSGKRVICRFNDVFLTVRVFGSGRKIIVAFHGYGQNGSDLQFIAGQNPEITLYSFDLFYHGESDSPSPRPPLSHQLFHNLFEDFLLQKKIESFDLLGFSMGGKYALSLIPDYYEQINRLILVAPDGIKKDFWYALATDDLLFQKLFRRMVHKPEWFFKMALFLDRIKLVDGRARKFALHEMNTFEKRNRVYNSWVYLKKFFVSESKLMQTLNTHQIRTTFVLGEFDRIIKVREINKFANKLKYKSIILLPTGHSGIYKKFVEKSELILMDH